MKINCNMLYSVRLLFKNLGDIDEKKPYKIKLNYITYINFN